jgi:hypothetical protein
MSCGLPGSSCGWIARPTSGPLLNPTEMQCPHHYVDFTYVSPISCREPESHIGNSTGKTKDNSCELSH